MNCSRFALSELAQIKYGKNQSKVENPNGKYPIYGTGGLMSYTDEFLYDKPSVLIGRKGTIGKVRYMETPFWTVDTLFYTVVNDEIINPKYLYYKLSQIDLNEYNEGTTIPSLRTDTLNRIELDIQDRDTQERIVKIISPIENKIASNNRTNDNLRHILYCPAFIR
jgi:type I restriction-modification system specificity determinant protein